MKRLLVLLAAPVLLTACGDSDFTKVCVDRKTVAEIVAVRSSYVTVLYNDGLYEMLYNEEVGVGDSQCTEYKNVRITELSSDRDADAFEEDTLHLLRDNDT